MRGIVYVLAATGGLVVVAGAAYLARQAMARARHAAYQRRLQAIRPLVAKYPHLQFLLATLPPGDFLGLLTFLSTCVTFHDRFGGDMRDIGLGLLREHGVTLSEDEQAELTTIPLDDVRCILAAVIPPG